jgi:hypothetical protein
MTLVPGISALLHPRQPIPIFQFPDTFLVSVPLLPSSCIFNLSASNVPRFVFYFHLCSPFLIVRLSVFSTIAAICLSPVFLAMSLDFLFFFLLDLVFPFFLDFTCVCSSYFHSLLFCQSLDGLQMDDFSFGHQSRCLHFAEMDVGSSVYPVALGLFLHLSRAKKTTVVKMLVILVYLPF